MVESVPKILLARALSAQQGPNSVKRDSSLERNADMQHARTSRAARIGVVLAEFISGGKELQNLKVVE